MITPKPLPQLSEAAEKCLQSLEEANLSHFLSLGGALGLSHYYYRSTQLSDPLQVPWLQGMWLDSFEDLISSRMVALVERGAPRDFRDIYMVCQRGLIDVTTCWQLWQTRQKLAKQDTDLQRARLAVRSHLARIERARPLENIVDIQQREEAAKLRQWFGEVFCNED